MNAFITSTGAFLPGPPVGNDDMEQILGLVDGKPSRLKARILKANGIRTRHYAIDREHRTTHSNVDMAVAAARNCLDASPVTLRGVGLLSCATTQGDMVIPGFGSMVQAGLALPAVELFTAHGICSSSAMAVKAAVNSIRVGEHRAALVVVSELASRLFKNTRYEAAGGHAAIDFNSEFLRWMLSDGAGAWLLESAPRGRCLRIDWMRGFSHANAFPVCMGIGTPTDMADTRTWQDFPTYAQAESAGALLIRQDVRLLEHIVKLGVDGALRLIEEETLVPAQIDHFLCHYSSHHFRGKIADMLDMSGASIPQEKWFTNLYTRGNTGAASILIMLDEFLREVRPRAGEKILCMVPESGRFNTAYMQLTVVEA
ncbi:MAG TPA: beta-ketoacyl-ACP synthase III [Steroidobacteraceae bacterium]|nr:beta-ketoacyl-ACP synthase III [Steroidobacteraceae bacterium]